MKKWSYSIDLWHGKNIIRLTDPLWHHPWYVKSFSLKNGYRWTREPMMARTFSAKYAQSHVDALNNGADADWEAYHNHWEEYYRSIGVLDRKTDNKPREIVLEGRC